MRKVFLFAVVMVLTGFVLRFFHFSINGFLMIFGLILMYMITVFSWAKRNKYPHPTLSLALSLWLTLLVFSVKFIPFATGVLVLAIFATIGAVFAALGKRLYAQLVGVLWAIILSVSFYLLPTDQRYYVVGVKWNYKIDKDYKTWDKYSWFLYQNNKLNEAKSASAHALNIANQEGELIWVATITSHQAQMENKSWKKYP